MCRRRRRDILSVCYTQSPSATTPLLLVYPAAFPASTPTDTGLSRLQFRFVRPRPVGEDVQDHSESVQHVRAAPLGREGLLLLPGEGRVDEDGVGVGGGDGPRHLGSLAAAEEKLGVHGAERHHLFSNGSDEKKHETERRANARAKRKSAGLAVGKGSSLVFCGKISYDSKAVVARERKVEPDMAGCGGKVILVPLG